MEMDKLAVFFAGSILVTLGMVVIACGIIVINNLIHQYWKPVTWFKYQYKPVYFDPQTGEQLVKETETTTKAVDGKSK